MRSEKGIDVDGGGNPSIRREEGIDVNGRKGSMSIEEERQKRSFGRVEKSGRPKGHSKVAWKGCWKMCSLEGRVNGDKETCKRKKSGIQPFI